MTLPALALLASIALANPEDVEVIPGVFRSERNTIQEIHCETLGGKEFMVFKFDNVLTGRNSRSRDAEDKRTNYGDNKSDYAYLEVVKSDDTRIKAAQMAWTQQCHVDIYYACGEQPDDRKHRLFPFYVETNCELQALTLKMPKAGHGFGF